MRWFAFQSMGLAAFGLLARSDGFQSRLGGGRRAPRPWCAGADAAAALTPRRAATSLLSAVPSYTPFDAERPIDPSEITFGQYLGAIGVLEVRGAAARWQQRGDRPPSTARSPLWERLSRSRSPVRFSCASLFTGPTGRLNPRTRVVAAAPKTRRHPGDGGLGLLGDAAAPRDEHVGVGHRGAALHGRGETRVDQATNNCVSVAYFFILRSSSLLISRLFTSLEKLTSFESHRPPPRVARRPSSPARPARRSKRKAPTRACCSRSTTRTSSPPRRSQVVSSEGRRARHRALVARAPSPSARFVSRALAAARPPPCLPPPTRAHPPHRSAESLRCNRTLSLALSLARFVGRSFGRSVGRSTPPLRVLTSSPPPAHRTSARCSST